MKAGKIWGTTEELFGANNVEIHRIEVVPGGYCSEHHHDGKWNMFFVEDGQLEVLIWPNPEGKPDTTVLESGDSCAVPPGQVHKFRAISRVIAYEIYWVSLNPNDIARRTVGGIGT